MDDDKKHLTPIGLTDFRNEHKQFYIKDADRALHSIILGRTGQGKTSLMLNMTISDIAKGKGICFLDSHADAVETLLNHVGKDKVADVVYFNATDKEYPMALNPLFNVPPEEHHLVADNLITTFRRVWQASWGNRMEYTLKQSILTLLHYPGASLLHIQRLLTDKSFREEVLMYVPDIQLRLYWFTQFDTYSSPFRNEVITPILGKVGVFNSNPILRNIVGQPGCLNFKQMMNTNKIVLVNLAKGIIGNEASLLLGSIILNLLFHAALSRANEPIEARVPFYTYVDELGSYMNVGKDDATALASQLSELRKYKMALCLSTQYLEQLPETIQAAIFGNVGTIVCFQIGNRDAETMEKEFYPVFSASDFVALPRFSMYLKLAINGSSSKGFSALSLPVPQISISYKNDIIAYSRATYSTGKEILLELPTVSHKPRTQNTLFDV